MGEHIAIDGSHLPLEEAEQIADQPGVRKSCELLVGDIVEEVVLDADSQDVDLIVVGSRGQGALASVLIGNVSRRVLSESRITTFGHEAKVRV